MKNLVILLLFAAGAAFGQNISTEQAENIIKLGGLEQSEKIIITSIEKIVAKQKASLDEDSYTFLSGAMAAAFNADSVHNAFVTGLGNNLDPKNLKAIEKFLNSPLSFKMTQLERESESADFVEEVPAKRKKIIDRLIKMMKPGEALTNMIFPPTIAVMKATSSEAVDKSDEEIQEAMKPMAKMMQGMMDAMLPGQYAGIYSSATDKELDSYVRFYESATGISYMESLRKATSETMNDRLELMLELYRAKNRKPEERKKL